MFRHLDVSLAAAAAAAAAAGLLAGWLAGWLALLLLLNWPHHKAAFSKTGSVLNALALGITLGVLSSGMSDREHVDDRLRRPRQKLFAKLPMAKIMLVPGVPSSEVFVVFCWCLAASAAEADGPQTNNGAQTIQMQQRN